MVLPHVPVGVVLVGGGGDNGGIGRNMGGLVREKDRREVNRLGRAAVNYDQK